MGWDFKAASCLQRLFLWSIPMVSSKHGLMLPVAGLIEQQLAVRLLYSCHSSWVGLMASLILCRDLTLPTASKADDILSPSREDTDDFLLCPLPQKQDLGVVGRGTGTNNLPEPGCHQGIFFSIGCSSERGPPTSNYFSFAIQTCLDKFQGLHYEESF